MDHLNLGQNSRTCINLQKKEKDIPSCELCRSSGLLRENKRNSYHRQVLER